MTIVAIDHVQLAMPQGREDDARAFYMGLLEIPEVAKPRALASRGGAWFEAGSVRVHLGVDPDFKPARKAHPGLAVAGLAVLIRRLRDAGYEVLEDSTDGRCHAYVSDPFGNRIELVES